MENTQWAVAFFENLVSLQKEVFPNKSPEAGRDYFDISPFSALLDSAPGMSAVYNFRTQGYEYFSANASKMVGYDADEFLRGGLAFSMSTFDEKHAAMYTTHVLPLMLQDIAKYSAERRIQDVRLNYCFKVRLKHGDTRWFLQQMQFLQTDENGLPVRAVILMTDVHDVKTDTLLTYSVSEALEGQTYKTVFHTGFPEHPNSPEFSRREIEILKLLDAGLTSDAIADRLFIAKNTVDTHRKNMLQKTGAKNTVDLLKIAAAGGVLITKI